MSDFKISYPLTPVSVNQGFGVNGAYYQANGVNVKGHNGIDFFAYHGQPLHAPMDGLAYYEEDDSGGHGVVIVSKRSFPYKNSRAFFKCILWHMCDPAKEARYASPVFLQLGSVINSGNGVPVKQGDLVGFADSTGLSSGDHLHFGLKPIMDGKAPLVGDAPDVNIGHWKNVEKDNGYLGAIDPQPYFDGTFVSAGSSPSFSRDLHIGMTGEDVRDLQKFLNANGFPVAASGAGSLGHETSSFGSHTQQSLIQFQRAKGITPASGYFGPITQAYIAHH